MSGQKGEGFQVEISIHGEHDLKYLCGEWTGKQAREPLVVTGTPSSSSQHNPTR